MRSRVIIVVAAALAVVPLSARDRPAQPNARGEAELAKLVDGRTAGAPIRCIDASPGSALDNARIIDGTAIVYDQGRTLYVNRPQGNLDTLHDDDVLVSEVWGSQHCSLDRVRTVERGSGFPHSYMVLGEFVPYTRAAR